MTTHSLSTCVVLFCLLCIQSVTAQEKDAEAKKQALRKERLEEMRKLVAALKVEAGQGDDAKEIKVKAEPVLRFDDATRAFYDGAVWIFADGGRPYLLAATERYEDKWSIELTLTAPPPVTLTNVQGWTWKPRLPPFEDRNIADLAPSERSEARKREMSKIAGRFTAMTFYGVEGRRELRLMARPLWQYQDEKQGVLDGAMFAYANGTNPEMLLMLEARADKEGKRAWHYGLQRLSGARIEMELDGKLVLELDGGGPPKQQKAYTYFQIPFEPETEAE